MCGIIGFVNSENAVEKTIQGLKILQNRGKDAIGLYDGEKTVYSHSSFSSSFSNLVLSSPSSSLAFGHVLHAIESKIPQPLQDNQNNVLIFNGEIYNYKQLNKQLKIETENDSQTLLHFLTRSLSPHSLSPSLVLPSHLLSSLESLDGDYAFAYLNQSKIYLVRDELGVKPLWYYYNSKTKSFEFASEKKAIHKQAQEVLPCEIIVYDIHSKKIESIKKKPITLPEETTDSYSKIKQKTWELFVQAVKKRIPSNKKKKIGLLFSGGIDSTAIALVLQELHIPFTCYTAEIIGNNLEQAQDVTYAKEIAKKHNLQLKIATTTIEDLEPIVKETIQLIEDTDYIKVSVALPFFLACNHAKKDNIDIMFSGLGSEEIFAGYRRHKQAENPNQECVEGLKILHQRDLYRDDVITMNFTQELRVPFLDKNLIKYALQIPAKYKLDLNKIQEIKDEVEKKPYLNAEVRSKIVLRDCVRENTNLEEKYIERQKKAAQYGSKFDKGLLRLAKNNKLSKQEYLNKLIHN
jgi:asparagine synthase (glutamine-hydrolysing)